MSEYKDWPGYTKLRSLAFEIAADEGWTPPQAPATEFKDGDFVEIKWRGRNVDTNWHLCVYVEISHGGSDCKVRHAPSWLKWEVGNLPCRHMKVGTVWEEGDGQSMGVSTGRRFIEMDNGRWAWLPLEDE